ncbi:MAG TPA: zinc ribbon domain-containing protein, partial [Solirubrobacteraceae bacterium]|nr:zinc ribbon domain-containing protein [Solirubrobacteraceae bacterium]
MSSLAPVPAPSDSSTCANCGAPLAEDQRYCLSCGQPVSPVRLAFLDVLEGERQSSAAAPATLPVAYSPYVEPVAGPAWLRRYAPLFGV